MNMQPRVSVVMAVRNGGDYLRAALDSLQAQSFADFELIVIDDGSVDATAEILNSWPDQRMVRMRNPQGLGLAASLNRGILAARGEYIARQDADDLAKPSRLQRQVAFLESHPQAVLLGTAYEVVDAQGNFLEIQRQPEDDQAIRWQMLFQNAFCHTSVMMRNFGLRYDANLVYAQDFELWSRYLKLGQVANLYEPLVCLRQHNASMSSGGKPAQQESAGRIALGNMAETLGTQPDPQLAAHLRAWYYGSPDRLPENGGAALLLLLRLLKRAGTTEAMNIWADRIIRHPDASVLQFAPFFFRYSPLVSLRALLMRVLGRTTARPDRVRDFSA